MLRWLIGIGVVMGVAAAAGGQTTQPSPAGWTKTVTDFASAVSAGDIDALKPMIGADCNIHTFQIDHPTGIRQLLEFATAQTTLGSHAYVQPAAALAADVAEDVAKSDVVSSDAKKSLIVDDIEAQNKATATAIHWVSSTLRAEDGALIGTVELWNPNTVATTDNPAHPVFVLFKGISNSAGGWTITTIVYGDPLQN